MITFTREEAQQVLDALKHLCLHSRAIAGYDGEKVQPPIDMLKAKLKQPEQVIQARKEGDLIVVDLPQVPTGSGGIHKEQEPVAWISTSPARMIHWKSDKPVYDDDWKPLYTAQPQRDEASAKAAEWIGLTDEEYFGLQMKIKTPMISVGDYIDAMRMVEKKLKEKNGF
jgi:hypothetical protein